MNKSSWMRLVRFFAIVSAAAVVLLPRFARAQSYTGWQAVTVTVTSQAELETLEQIYHVPFSNHGGIGANVVLLPPESVAELEVSGLPFEVNIGDYQDYLDDEAELRTLYGGVPATQPAVSLRSPWNPPIALFSGPGPTPPLAMMASIQSDWYWTWHTHDEIVEKLDALYTQYSASTDLDMEVFSLGQSAEGRAMPTLRFTRPSSVGQKPALYLRSGIHAAEQVAIMAAMYMVEAILVSYAEGDPETADLLERVEIYYTPLQNPDGYHHFRSTGDLNVRKSRNDYQASLGMCPLVDDGFGNMVESNQARGVELNRNWDVDFCNKSASTNHCLRDFCGPSPMSEPEVQNIAEFVLNTPNLAGNIDIHAYTQLVLTPWAFDSSLPPPHATTYANLRAAVISEVEAVHGQNYHEDLTYDLSGDSGDWMAMQGLWSLAYESRPFLIDPYPDGFEPENSEMVPTVIQTGEELLAGTLYFASWLAEDMDQDGVINGFDNCPETQNFLQRDCDGNNIGDACDTVTPSCVSDSVVLLDHSGSMSFEDGYTGAQRGAHALSGFGAYLYNSFFFPGETRTAMVGFADNPACLAYPSGSNAFCDFIDIKESVTTPGTPAATIEDSVALQALNHVAGSYAAGGLTNILGAVEFGLSSFVNAPTGTLAAQQYMYLLSDGQQTVPFDAARYDTLIQTLRTSYPELVISALAVTPEADMEALLSYTHPTHGAIGYAEEANGVPVYWHDVAARTIRDLAVVAGPGFITTPADIIVPKQDSANGIYDFVVGSDATALQLVMSSRDQTWGIRVTLTDPVGNTFSRTSHPEYFSTTAYDPALVIAHIPDPVAGEWSLVTGTSLAGGVSSNFIVTEINPVASVQLDGDTPIVGSGSEVEVTPTIVYDGVPIDVNSTECSVIKITAPGGLTFFPGDPAPFSFDMVNTAERIAQGLPPTFTLEPFAGRGYYTIYVNCTVDASAESVPGTQLSGMVGEFSHNTSYTFFADVPDMPPCSSDDCDGDGVPNDEEGTGDTDGDGWEDPYDTDSDNDEAPDAVDNCPHVYNPDQADSDQDGVGDACDADVSCIYGTEGVWVSDYTDVIASIGSAGYIELGADSVVEGSLRSGGDIFFRERAVLDGSAWLSGTPSYQNSVTITGTVFHPVAVDALALASRGVPYGTMDVELSLTSTCEQQLAPGAYGAVFVDAGCTLTLTAGNYAMRELYINADAAVMVAGAVNLDVAELFHWGDRAVLDKATESSHLRVYTNQTQLVHVGPDSVFAGTLIAPAAGVAVYSRAQIAGCMRANSIRIEPQAVWVGDATAAPPNNQQPGCTEDTAIDLGSHGNATTVATDACVMVRDQYPSWWGERTMQLQTGAGGSYDVPFSWSSSCTGGSGSGVFTGQWQSQFFGPTNSSCATLLSLHGEGSGTVTLRYY